jgi:1-acyl-sn-glycerol-3-phosphate acyltransferase
MSLGMSPVKIDAWWSGKVSKLFKVPISATDRNPADVYDTQSLLLVCLNQTSLIENVALHACLPPNAAHRLCVFANAEYLLHPFGWPVAARSCPVVLQSRAQRRRAFATCEARLREGATVYISAEGRRRSERDGRLSPYHHGAARLALATGATIVPVFYQGASCAMLVGAWRVNPGAAVHVEFCEAIRVLPLDGERGGKGVTDCDVRALTEQLRGIAESRLTLAPSEGSQKTADAGEQGQTEEEGRRVAP